MIKEVYIVRHGRTEFNKLGIWQGSSVDSALDELGWKQSELFYDAYKNHNFDLIVHSALQRSKQTVQSFLGSCKTVLEKSEINEISWGYHEGKAHTEKSLGEYKYVVSEWQKGNYEIAFSGGESAKELGQRIGGFVDWLRDFKCERVLICSHGRAIRALLCLLKEEPLKQMEKYRHANTGVFKFIQEGKKFKEKFLNNTDHLF